MTTETHDGWDASAQAWLSLMGDEGDFSRAKVLDAPMLARVEAARPGSVLDVGCGEGRFCRMMAKTGAAVTGLDPTEALLCAARAGGAADYVQGRAEEMPFANGSFDMVVSYLSLIDISDMRTGIAEMARVLKPGGRLLIGNLNSWITASQIRGDGWVRHDDGSVSAWIDRYLEEYAYPAEWGGVRIVNWHRPMSAYMQALLLQNLTLMYFDEPRVNGTSEDMRKNRAPYLYLMEWQNPG